MLGDPIATIRSRSAVMLSASHRSPAIAPTRDGPAARIRSAMTPNASPQLAACSRPSRRTYGRSSRRRRSPSNENRPLSAIHSSFTSSFVLGRIRSTSPARQSMRMFVPVASVTSTLSFFANSQGRATNAYGLDVNAPTGQMSIRQPDNSDVSAFST